ncbi:hypothetical protein [Engelhardtia mirabilis]|uniref:DinB family protein n=1 Tax=Engelhardtia mirabilis TaxID=2528011 RepID=A0A518BF23_9BACT|nr:hypothetical protein Pla133_06520 [Planctomycetes bacterium Pla133]QDU99912.1 hypothetical protein Pla86_06510 [Planctomycetes bacterium Pla86]
MSASPERRETLLAAQNVVVLEQGLEVFERLGGTSADGRSLAALYTAVPDGLTQSGVGGHFRHIHDYYRCFLGGLESGRVDYDLRARDPRFETELAYAGTELRGTIERLCEIVGRDDELVVKMDEDHSPGAPDPWSRSTVMRELRFLLSHTIHHYALIAMILKVQGFDCGSGFGVAPSTLEYWETRTSCAPSPGSDQ